MSFLKEIFRSIARVFGRVIAYVIIGLIIYLIASSRVDAKDYRYLNNNSNGTGSWTTITDNQEYTNSTITLNSTGKTFFQFRDTFAFSGSNKYDLQLDFEFSITGYSNKDDLDVFINIYPELFNGSTLQSTGSKCSIIRVDRNTYGGTALMYNNTLETAGSIVCTGLSGSGYYPYFSFSARQTGTGNVIPLGIAKIKFIRWQYTRNTSGDDANSIISANNQNTQDIINSFNSNTQSMIDEYKKTRTEIYNSVTEVNDSITDTSEPTDYSFFNDIGLSNDTPISNMILFPVTLLNAINTSTASSCSPVSLGSLFGNELVLPCINLEQRLGSTLWSNIDTLTSIIIIYNLVMMVVAAFEDMTSLNDSYTSLTARHSAENVEYKPRHGGGS